MSVETNSITAAWHLVRKRLLAERTRAGHWIGQLSSSALATATAVSALSEYRRGSVQPRIPGALLESQIERGLGWLCQRQNGDGGWGDTDLSHSNIATTMLAVAAIQLAGRQVDFGKHLQRANQFIDENGRIEGLKRRYGNDKTFAVPILTNGAIAGLVEWTEISDLPCEAAAVPQAWYRFLRLPVVSYAIPALVAIGQAKFLADPPRNPFKRVIRRVTLGRGLHTLETIQPANGGYLEAVPLTSFVVMSLCHSGRADHDVAHRGAQFIVDSFREQGETGTWPIDTNLATWNTTLAVNAVCSAEVPPPDGVLTNELLEWLLQCQYQNIHPYTGAAPGGWGWSDLSGSVPDADDTPGALLACRQWLIHGSCSDGQKDQIIRSARSGIRWLLSLQNRDRGWPTFCRGWGRLPFDRSGCDLTAHVIRALWVWRDHFRELPIDRAVERGFAFLEQRQKDDGSWLPLWFGNQDEADDENPVYGTSKVLMAYRDTNRIGTLPARQGFNWLVCAQNEDGGWGGGNSFKMVHERRGVVPGPECLPGHSSLQETALALDAMGVESNEPAMITARGHGLNWLLKAINHGYLDEKWPIGFYFAKLWYYERLYPLVFAASALQRYVGLGTHPATESGAMVSQANESGKTTPPGATVDTQKTR